MTTYEITFADKEGRHLWWKIHASDFQEACENALQSKRSDIRLIRVERLAEKNQDGNHTRA